MVDGKWEPGFICLGVPIGSDVYVLAIMEENLIELNEEEPILPKNHNVEMNDDDDLSKSTPSKFNCDICQKSFNSAGTLHTHKLRKHTENPKKWTCDQCGKEFNCRKNMSEKCMKSPRNVKNVNTAKSQWHCPTT